MTANETEARKIRAQQELIRALEKVSHNLASIESRIPQPDRLQKITNSEAKLPKLQYFKIFRAYRICEQNLLNHRVTWNLAVQGFLFATYGFSLQKSNPTLS